MICEPCKDKSHAECKGTTWCDCQHKPPAQKIGVPGIASGESVGNIGGSGDSQNSHVSYGSAIHGNK